MGLKIVLWSVGSLLFGLLLYFAWQGMYLVNQLSRVLPVQTVKTEVKEKVEGLTISPRITHSKTVPNPALLVTDVQSMELQKLVQVVQVVMLEMNKKNLESIQTKSNIKKEVTLQSDTIITAMVDASTLPIATIFEKKEDVENKVSKIRELQSLLLNEIDNLSEEEVNSLSTILSVKMKKQKSLTKNINTYNKVIRKQKDSVNLTDSLSQIAKDISSVVDIQDTMKEDKYTTSIKKEVNTRVNAMHHEEIKEKDKK